MPLPLRQVEPVNVARGTLPEGLTLPNDLEAVADGTLANVIMQLSSLSHHAGELFSDLIRVGSEIASRANNLQARIDRLAVKVSQIDNLPDETTSMQDALNTKPFQSAMAFDQQVVSRPSMPSALRLTYESCDKPPPLDKLNPYRDDGKDGLKFYTDSGYFFELWRQQMLKDPEKVIRKPNRPKHEGGHRHKKRVRTPHNTRERHRYIALEHGEHIGSTEYTRQQKPVQEVPDGVIYQAEMTQIQQDRNSVTVQYAEETLEYNSKPHSSTPIGNGVSTYARGDYRNDAHYSPYSSVTNNHLNHYNQQSSPNMNDIHARIYSPISPPHPYSDNSIGSNYTTTSMSSPRSGSSGMLSRGYSSQGTVSVNNGLRPNQPPPAPPMSYSGSSSHIGMGTPSRGMRNQSYRETLPPPPPPPVELDNSSIGDRSSLMPPPPPMTEEENDEPLPPPPTPDQEQLHLRQPHIPEEQLPPSPPPPPPEAPPAPPMPVVTQNMLSAMNGNPKKIEKKPKVNVPAPVVDGKSELLKAIRKGIELRKVDSRKEPAREDKTGSAYCDVASILARRVAVEMSDSESGSESEYDSDGWDETSA